MGDKFPEGILIEIKAGESKKIHLLLFLGSDLFLRSGKRDSNPRPSAWEADALPTELFPQFICGANVQNPLKKDSNFFKNCLKSFKQELLCFNS